MNRVMAVFGPTGSGKTSFARSLLENAPADSLLVSVDSRKVYQELTIGTHKDELLTIARDFPALPVGGYDLISPTQTINASVFQEHVYDWLEHQLTTSSRRTLILFGGTGLFLDSILFALPHRQTPANESLRAELEDLPLAELQQRLQQTALDRWSSLNPSDQGNPRRLIRQLELTAAQSVSSPDPARTLHNRWPRVLSFIKDASLELFLPALPKEKLFERINKRVAQMITHGWCEEVGSLLQQYSPTAPGLSIMGYKELVRHIQDPRSFPLAATTDEIALRHRQYAKRQLTWINRYTAGHDPYKEMIRTLKEIDTKSY